jgi:hypothetical protein
MTAMAKHGAAIVLAGAALFGSLSAHAWWNNDDDYYDRWHGGRWYGGPYGWGGYPGYGWGGYPGYGWGGYPGYGWGGYPGGNDRRTVIVYPQVSVTPREQEQRVPK